MHISIHLKLMILWFQDEERGVGVQQISNIHAHGQVDIAQSFPENSKASQPFSHSWRVDVNAELMRSTSSRHGYVQVPDISSLYTSCSQDCTKGRYIGSASRSCLRECEQRRDIVSATASCHNDCEKGDLVLLQEGVDNGSVQDATHHMNTSMTLSMLKEDPKVITI